MAVNRELQSLTDGIKQGIQILDEKRFVAQTIVVNSSPENEIDFGNHLDNLERELGIRILRLRDQQQPDFCLISTETRYIGLWDQNNQFDVLNPNGFIYLVKDTPI